MKAWNLFVTFVRALVLAAAGILLLGAFLQLVNQDFTAGVWKLMAFIFLLWLSQRDGFWKFFRA